MFVYPGKLFCVLVISMFSTWDGKKEGGRRGNELSLCLTSNDALPFYVLIEDPRFYEDIRH